MRISSPTGEFICFVQNRVDCECLKLASGLNRFAVWALRSYA